MLRKHAQFFKSLFIISDLLIISFAWILSYILRFYISPIKPPLLGTPPFLTYVEFLLPLWIIWGLFSNSFNLYRPRRIGHFFEEFIDIVKVLVSTFLILIAVSYLLRRFEFSRLAFLYFLGMSFIGFLPSRFLIRRTLKSLRKRRYNQRFALIAGTGELGQKILERIELYPELGIQVLGFLTRKTEEVGKKIKDILIVGVYEDLDRILEERKIDIFFIALPINEYGHLATLVRRVQSYPLDIKVLPGTYEFIGLRGGVDELDGLPIMSLQGSPLYGWNKVFKKLLDLAVGALLLVIVSPLLLAIGLIVKTTSKGPILFRQERIGMDGSSFQILKFRTMRTDAERETGPVWAQENDPRRTRIGAFLRKTSLDELPQLFNVLKGEMSLVGPRPERPNFVKEFRNRIPSYMLRHKIKTGMTGWAQINGWRGNTSLGKRIEHDLYYIQNWSIRFDLKILLMTLWRGFFNRSAC
jgi:Undecaprenyl-phosphate glucose phosphotransferase